MREADKNKYIDYNDLLLQQYNRHCLLTQSCVCEGCCAMRMNRAIGDHPRCPASMYATANSFSKDIAKYLALKMLKKTRKIESEDSYSSSG